jgi:hypothetical protein
MFASDTTKTIDLPFAEGHSAVIRKLSGFQLGKAQKAFFNDLIQGVVDRGGAKVQKDIEALFAKAPDEFNAEVAVVKSDPLNGLDKYTVVAMGVNQLSTRSDWAGLKSAERVALAQEMDEEALDFLATEVMRLTKPALFLTGEEAVAEKKGA